MYFNIIVEHFNPEYEQSSIVNEPVELTTLENVLHSESGNYLETVNNY